jgi:hypothetical protein
MRFLLCSVLGEHSNEGGLEVKRGLSRADRSDQSNVSEHCELGSKVTRSWLDVCRLEALIAAQKAQKTGNALGSA